jgi:hypothetical protein
VEIVVTQSRRRRGAADPSASGNSSSQRARKCLGGRRRTPSAEWQFIMTMSPSYQRVVIRDLRRLAFAACA